jgi:hypothetical protein
MTPVRATAPNALSIDFIRSNLLGFSDDSATCFSPFETTGSVGFEASRLTVLSVTAGICTRFGETKDRHRIVNKFFLFF